ncbi:MAG: LytTR family DNA-binding domain-containing protein [Agathobacter sp.]|nr:LytTR family DNA-binding domain-containing protein [Agathobacter sp.]MDY3796240.1 LytTR family DNA-binding domain-containing protein [Agathobacter sp.]
MKYTIEQISDGENEVIVRYSTFTSEIEQIVGILKNEKRRLIGTIGSEKILVELSDVLYIESVDGKSFAYTDCDVIKLEYTLMQLEQMIQEISFFRCSKSMIINIDKVKSLRSLASNRIDATMCNGEHVMISRTYASDFRKRLREGMGNE